MTIHDLSQVLYAGMPVYPGDPEFSASPVHTFEKDGVNVLGISLGTHLGTHLDVPRHFLREGASIDQVPLDRFCGPAQVVRIHWQTGDLLRIPEETLQLLHKDDILLLSTGWESKAGTKEYFQHYPRFSAGMPARLAKSGIKALALDLPSVKSEGPSRAMHVALLEAGIIIIEGLVNLDAIASPRVFFSAAPLKIQEGDGSPVRAYAIEGGVPVA